MRGFTAVALAALHIFGAGQAAWAQSHEQDAFILAIKAMKRSVTPVVCMRAVQAQQPAPRSQPSPARVPQYQTIIDGTAFFLTRQGDFITAVHVLDDFTTGHPLGNCPLTVWYEGASDSSGGLGGVAFVAALSDCIEDAVLDIARCHTINDMTKIYGGRFEPKPVQFDSRQRDDGTAIAITGFPLFNTTPVSSRGYIGGYPLDARGPIQMTVDRAAWPGGSGSPVYDSRGRVLGMLEQTGEGVASGISGARSSFAISKFLAAHPITNK
jgi:hypothetical protein